MPLLPPPDSTLSEAVRSRLAERPPIALYRTVAWSPGLLAPFLDLTNVFFQHTTLPHRLREVVIVRVAMHHNSRYEIHHHRGLALEAGVSAAELERLLSPVPCVLDDALATALVRFTDETLTGHAPSPPCFVEVERALGSQGTAELALLIGFYRMVATFVGATGIEPDAQTAIELRAQRAAAPGES